jgi:hypothetical protein
MIEYAKALTQLFAIMPYPRIPPVWSAERCQIEVASQENPIAEVATG